MRVSVEGQASVDREKPAGTRAVQWISDDLTTPEFGYQTQAPARLDVVGGGRHEPQLQYSVESNLIGFVPLVTTMMAVVGM